MSVKLNRTKDPIFSMAFKKLAVYSCLNLIQIIPNSSNNILNKEEQEVASQLTFQSW